MTVDEQDGGENKQGQEGVQVEGRYGLQAMTYAVAEGAQTRLVSVFIT